MKKKKSKVKSSYLPIVVLNNNNTPTKSKKKKIKSKTRWADGTNKDTVVYIQNYPPPGQARPKFMNAIGRRSGNAQAVAAVQPFVSHSEGSRYEVPVASASSGYGGGGECCGNEELSLLEGLIFLGALAAAVYFLNTQIAMFIGRRRKRGHIEQMFSDFIPWALDDFENKLDGLAGALDHDPESWISKIYNSMTYSEQENSTELAIADVPNVTESLGEEDVDEVNNGNLSLDKRSVHPDDEETFETFLPTNSPKSDFDCNTRFAQCLSRTADGSILKLVWKFIGSFGTGIVNLATEGSTGFWKIFSNIPEAQFCLSAKRDCDFEVKKQKNSNFERPDSQKLKQEENQI